MKKILLLLSVLLCASPAAFAGETYVGGSYGRSNLNYDLKGRAYEFIAQDKDASAANALIQQLGGVVNIEEDTNASYMKLFVGHRFNRYIGLELFYVDMDQFSIEADAHASTNPSASGGRYNVDVHGSVNGTYRGTADFKGLGVRVNAYAPVSDRLDFFGGLGVMKAKSSINTSYNIDAQYSYDAEASVKNHSDSVSGGRSYHDSGTGTDELSSYVPVIAVGVQYRVTDNIAVRGELERYGHPIENISIDSASVGIQYSF